ncbi:MAG: heme ABC transporter substrate-binding protein IsdE [Oscillospiraceae bacterium]|nr:heme ABC transporter substrate-binding protein IsdE [Oscillospiraceae bacterium]
MRRIILVCIALSLALALCACVDQHPEEDTAAESTAAAENAAANEDVEEPARIIATSYSTILICDKLGLDLVAVCSTSGELPERYQDLPTVGTAMSPDAEAIALLEPTDVIGPDTLAETIEPTYQAAGVPYTFIDLQSVQGMYDSIAMLGEKYGVSEAADTLIAEYEEILADFQTSIEGEEQPTVLLLMGLPGAYIECTPNSYAGSLLELAGAVNVVQVDDEMNFVSWNTEELLALDPDYILLTAHGLPELAMEMFAEEFTTNDIWKHFRAVEDGHVYQLDYTLFGMSCTFDWPEALAVLQEILYSETYEAYDAEAAYLENNS